MASSCMGCQAENSNEKFTRPFEQPSDSRETGKPLQVNTFRVPTSSGPHQAATVTPCIHLAVSHCGVSGHSG